MPLKSYSCPECLQFQKNTGIDIEPFLQTLTDVKRGFVKRETTTLSAKEVEYICLSLTGYSLGQIAYFFHKSRPDIVNPEKAGKWQDLKAAVDSLKSDMSKTVHKYIKELMGATRFPGWYRVRFFVEFGQYDYERQSFKPVPEVEVIEEHIEIRITIKNNKNLNEYEILNALQQLGYTTLSLWKNDDGKS